MVTSGGSRAKILNAGTQAILSSGAGGLRVDAVATAAVVNKRMIYHHFGDKQGLVEAVYGQQANRIASDGNTLRPETREILGGMVAPWLVVDSVPLVAVSALELQQAIKILLPVLMTRDPPITLELRINPEQWQVFALDVANLTFPELASEIVVEPRGRRDSPEVSDDSLTVKKPRYRLASISRRI